MTKKSVLQGGEEIEALFAQRRQVSAKAAKDLGSSGRAEAARHLLLHFEHANVTLGLGIVERHAQILQEGQRRLLVQTKTIEQIARRRLFASTFFRHRCGRLRRIGLIASLQHGLIACLPVSDFHGVERYAPLGSCLVAGVFHREQQLAHLVGPCLLLLFIEKEQFAQMVDMAQGMLARVEPVAAKAIMQASAAKVGQDVDGVEGGLAAFGVDGIVGQRGGGTDVEPPALAGHPHTAFILMEHVGPDQRRFDLLLHRFEQRRGPLQLRGDRGFRDGDAQQVPEHFACSSQRQQMLHHQQAGGRGHAASVLHAGPHLLGEGCRAHLAALRAAFLFGLMLDHHMTLAGQLNDLAGFDHLRLDSREFRLTVAASSNGMTNDLIWAARPLDGFPRMLGLASWLLGR